MLARGLRAKFASIARKAVPALLERFKEKKAIVVNALHEALSEMHPHCFTLQDIFEDVLLMSKHKVPQVKEQLVKFVYAASLTSPKTLLKKILSPLCLMYTTVGRCEIQANNI